MITIWEQAIAEFVGTFALVFIGTGAVMLDGSAGLLGIALAFGLVLAIMVSALGHISGAHFNPAVTIGAWVGGKIETMRAGLYILVQLVAAAAASLVLRALLPSLVWKGSHLGATLVTKQLPGFGAGKAVILEAILTFFLMLTVYATAVDDRGAFSKIAGLAIGLVLTMDILVGGLLTGASMNPARSFGPALVSGTWTDFWVFVIGPIAGAVLAAALYSFAFLRDRQVAAPREEVPIGGGPEEDLPQP
jgi:aquaporin Z